jgi:hypothetical protein
LICGHMLLGIVWLGRVGGGVGRVEIGQVLRLILHG